MATNNANNDVVLDGVTKQFGNVVAVDDLDLYVEQGSFLTLLGPSGCGKTTTLRMIAGFEEQTEGTITIADEDVSSVAPYSRPTSMVFQSYALFPHKTVGENVAFGLKMRDVSKEERQRRAEEMLELVSLGGYQDRSIDELSGGQQQRVALARALITEPTILLLDEPLGALDMKLREEMQVELKNLQNQLGTTFVYVTHDQEEALTMSDYIAVMNDGDVEQVGTATEIYEEPETRFVADFIGDTNLIDGRYQTRGSEALVVWGNIEIPVKDTDGFSDGESVTVSIRPEKIHLTGDDPRLSGAVDDVIYQGNTMKIHIDIDGQTLVVEEHVERIDELPTIGEEVSMTWDDTQTKLFRNSTDE
ncbi:ABC transporter ATP-binding protein [Natribaculum luteum]|uniref:Molybdate/tungstate import ATP-binding protein WtpC n=1 Tax=Natribaculum luteum TaxID=1586232 RepID=A0ABD5NVC2_9EURY|nr:ABC transporter ATP-binding protein [Natribaculum luteum]